MLGVDAPGAGMFRRPVEAFGREAAEHTAKSSIRAMPRRTLDLGYSFEHRELEPALRDLLGR